MIKDLPKEKIIFSPEITPEDFNSDDPTLPFIVKKSEDEKDVYLVEGPRIERMLGYTNLEDEKGFVFFQKFMKNNGILDQLNELGIQDGDTVRIYGHEFDYYHED